VSIDCVALQWSVLVNKAYRDIEENRRRCGHDPLQFDVCSQCWNENVLSLCLDLALLCVAKEPCT
jgi:hypothetical protein